MIKNNLQKGQILIEILLVMALTAIILPALLTGLFSSRQGKAQQERKAQAIALLQEAEEATRSVREKGWNQFAVNGTFHPVASGSAWALAAGSTTIDGMTRSVTLT